MNFFHPVSKYGVNASEKLLFAAQDGTKRHEKPLVLTVEIRTE
jgi:hypothetical protein